MVQTLGMDGLDACYYACIFMVMVVVHEVIVCSLCHHDVVGMFDVYVLVEIEQEMSITIARLQH